jgi:hypothetical protein
MKSKSPDLSRGFDVHGVGLGITLKDERSFWQGILGGNGDLGSVLEWFTVGVQLNG